MAGLSTSPLPVVGWWLTSGPPPAGSSWLGTWEKEFEGRLRLAPRRESWRLGRWASHQALVARFPELTAAELDVRQAPGGEPWPHAGGQRLPCTLSLSHRDGHALCAIGPPDLLLGCDLERIEARSEAFVVDYFTDSEQTIIRASGDVPLAANLIWSAKESALKALRAGLRRDTRTVVVELEPERAERGLVVLPEAAPRSPATRWARFRVNDRQGGGVLVGRACRRGALIITVTADRELAMEALPGPA
jgi:4'-phosphopantetheinyl transferase